MTDITTVEQLEDLYGPIHEAARIKEIDHITDHYRAYIEAAPLMVIASVGEQGSDCSPRGDPSGNFVRVIDPKTLLIPDRPGNNRIDTLRNIVQDPRVALLFLLPGIGITMRVNGRAALTTDETLCASMAMNGKPPKLLIRVTADQVYFQCPKSIIRGKIWDPNNHIDPKTLPTAGTMVQALEDAFDGDTFDRNYPERIKQTIY